MTIQKINAYIFFLLNLNISIINFFKKYNYITNLLNFKTYKYIPLSFQQSLLITYLRQKNTKDISSLVILNCFYLSLISMVIYSTKLEYKIRYIGDSFILLTFIQETMDTCFACGIGNKYLNNMHTFFFVITLFLYKLEVKKYKYYKINRLIYCYYLYTIVYPLYKKIPIFSLFNKKKYEQLPDNKKKEFNKFIFCSQYLGLITLNISRIIYDKKNEK